MKTGPGTQSPQFWPKVIKNTSPEGMLHKAMDGVVQNLTMLTGQPITLASLDIETIPVENLTALSDDRELERIGIYLLLTDEELSGEAIIMLRPDEAMVMVDWLLEVPPAQPKSWTPWRFRRWLNLATRHYRLFSIPWPMQPE